MGGGLLNLVAYGNQNTILNGNPSKTFFKFTYNKYTNFGLQKFRIDMQGQRILNLTQESKFTFKVPRYADLLLDTYLVVNLPNIWSPILPPKDCSGQWRPYEFKWINNLGSQIIKDVTFTVGGQTIQKFSGDYIYNLVERDFRGDKKLLFYKMTGNTKELNDPANYNNRNGYYPNAWHTSSPSGTQPSISAQTLYIPINIWFTLSSKMAFPLVSLQYNELHIEFTLRPIQDLFVVRNVSSSQYWKTSNSIPSPSSTEMEKGPYIKTNQNESIYQFYRFIQQPPDNILSDTAENYINKNTNWNTDIHLMSTYAFLSQEEVQVFALQPQNYLIKEIHEYTHENISGSKKISLDSMGMVANWMFYLQRTDVSIRNEWTNYSNWPYNEIPNSLIASDPSGYIFSLDCSAISPCCPEDPSGTIIDGSYNLPNAYVSMSTIGYGPGTQPGGYYGNSGIKITGDYSDENQKNILISAAILCDGKYRENVLPAGVYNLVEKYVRTFGYASDMGLYCYNFGFHTDPFDFQPSGAMNLSKFNDIEFELQTYYPPLDPNAQTLTICDPSGNIIGINKPVWNIYQYTYNFKLMEERYNILKFISGNAGLMYSR